MKKSILTALCLAIPAMAGEPVIMAVTPIQAPVIAPAPACSMALEAGVVYTDAMSDLAKGIDGIDTWGFDVTALYKLDDNLALNLRFNWATGDDKYTTVYQRGEFSTNTLTLTTWSIMPGLRYTAPLTDGVSCFVGANAGVAKSTLEYEFYDSLDQYSASAEDKDWGFAYSVEAGLKVDVCDNVYIYGALQFSGNTAKPAKIDSQYGLGVRAGLGWEF